MDQKRIESSTSLNLDVRTGWVLVAHAEMRELGNYMVLVTPLFVPFRIICYMDSGGWIQGKLKQAHLVLIFGECRALDMLSRSFNTKVKTPPYTSILWTDYNTLG